MVSNPGCPARTGFTGPAGAGDGEVGTDDGCAHAAIIAASGMAANRTGEIRRGIVLRFSGCARMRATSGKSRAGVGAGIQGRVNPQQQPREACCAGCEAPFARRPDEALAYVILLVLCRFWRRALRTD